jgi:hypothetical protein
LPLPLNLPAAPPIDESRRGILSIAPDVLLHLLRVPGNHRVGDLRITMHGTLQIEIIGEDMPEGWLPKPVVMTDQAKDERRVFGSWEHDPERRWLIRQEPIPRPARQHSDEQADEQADDRAGAEDGDAKLSEVSV